MTRMPKCWLLGALGVVLVINPYLACSSSNERNFEYSEADMKVAVVGNWIGMADLDGESVPFTLSLEQAAAPARPRNTPPGVKPACRSRSFVKSAAACVSQSVMPLVGILTSAHPGLNGPVTGELVALLALDNAGLRLQFDDGRTMYGTVDDGEVKDGRVSDAGVVGAFSLERP